MAHFSYESVWVLFTIIMLLIVVLSVKIWGDTLSEIFAFGSVGLVQEHISSFTSMVLIAPKYFYVEETFPATNHTVKITSDGFIDVEPGKTALRISFEKEKPFPFVHDDIYICGKCASQSGCVMNSTESSVIVINKTETKAEVKVVSK